MDLNRLREERKKWLTWKNIAPYQEAIKALKTYENVEVKLGDRVEVQIQESQSPRCSADKRDSTSDEALAKRSISN